MTRNKMNLAWSFLVVLAAIEAKQTEAGTCLKGLIADGMPVPHNKLDHQ